MTGEKGEDISENSQAPSLMLNIAFRSQNVTLGSEEESKARSAAFNATTGRIDATTGGREMARGRVGLFEGRRKEGLY